jgi:hypothetical protein
MQMVLDGHGQQAIIESKFEKFFITHDVRMKVCMHLRKGGCVVIAKQMVARMNACQHEASMN